MANEVDVVRVIDLEDLSQEVQDGQYILADSSEDGTGKLNLKNILQNFVESYEKIDNEVARFFGNGFLDLGTLIADTYIQSSDGEAAYWNGTKATDFLPCFMADQLETYIKATNGYHENAFYTKDKTFISSFPVVAGENVVTVPNNAFYVRFSNINANMATLVVKWKIAYDLNWKSTIFVAPYGNDSQNTFDVYNDGTTIVVYSQRYIVYSDKSWKLFLQSNPVLSVPHDKFAVYNDSAEQIQVKTYEEIQAMTGRYYVLFYNSYGKMTGPFVEYCNSDYTGRDYPVYYDSHVKSKIDTINMQLAALTSGDAFVFITDIHYPDNKMRSPALIHDICNKTNIRKVILNGDYINKELGSKPNALMQINRVCALYEYPAIETYRVVGNHEFNNPGNAQDQQHLAGELSASELRFAILNSVQNKVVIDPDSLSYYWDDEDKQIRYFVAATTKTSGTVPESIRFMGRNVETIPSGYGVIIFEHTVLSASGGTVHPVNDYLTGLFDAMKAKTTFDYLGTQFDYTGKTFDFIACFCGDYHLDMDYTTTNGALVIGTTCDTMQQEGSLSRNSGTYTEQAFDVVTVNRTTRKINLTRIGAGNDREFSF